MNALETVFALVVDGSVRVGLVLALCLLGRRWLKRHLPAASWFALWIVLAVALLVPAGVPSRWSPFNLLPGSWTSLNAPAGIDPATEDSISIPATSPVAVESPATGMAAELSAPALLTRDDRTSLAPAIVESRWALIIPRWSMLQWLAVAWLAGAVVLATWRFSVGLWFQRQLARSLRPSTAALERLVESCRRELGIRRRVRVAESPLVGGPALCGILRPCVLIPEAVAQRLSAAELRLIVLHELGHVRRHDLLAARILKVAAVLHWFNPFVWLAVRAARTDVEQACDEFVLRRIEEDEREDYGAILLKVLGLSCQRRALPPILGFSGDKVQLKERIELIAQYSILNRGRLFLGGALLAMLGMMSLTRAAVAQAPAFAAGNNPRSWLEAQQAAQAARKAVAQKGAAEVGMRNSIDLSNAIFVGMSGDGVLTWQGEAITPDRFAAMLNAASFPAGVVLQPALEASHPQVLYILGVLQRRGLPLVYVQQRDPQLSPIRIRLARDEPRPFGGDAIIQMAGDQAAWWTPDNGPRGQAPELVPIGELPDRIRQWESTASPPGTLFIWGSSGAKFRHLLAILERVDQSGTQRAFVGIRAASDPQREASGLFAVDANASVERVPSREAARGRLLFSVRDGSGSLARDGAGRDTGDRIDRQAVVVVGGQGDLYWQGRWVAPEGFLEGLRLFAVGGNPKGVTLIAGENATFGSAFGYAVNQIWSAGLPMTFLPSTGSPLLPEIVQPATIGSFPPNSAILHLAAGGDIWWTPNGSAGGSVFEKLSADRLAETLLPWRDGGSARNPLGIRAESPVRISVFVKVMEELRRTGITRIYVQSPSAQQFIPNGTAAIEALKDAASRSPNEGKFDLQIAMQYQQLNDLPRALESAKQAAAKGVPGRTGSVWLQVAYFAYTLGRYQEALEAVEKAAEFAETRDRKDREGMRAAIVDKLGAR